MASPGKLSLTYDTNTNGDVVSYISAAAASPSTPISVTIHTLSGDVSFNVVSDASGRWAIPTSVTSHISPTSIQPSTQVDIEAACQTTTGDNITSALTVNWIQRVVESSTPSETHITFDPNTLSGIHMEVKRAGSPYPANYSKAVKAYQFYFPGYYTDNPYSVTLNNSDLDVLFGPGQLTNINLLYSPDLELAYSSLVGMPRKTHSTIFSMSTHVTYRHDIRTSTACPIIGASFVTNTFKDAVIFGAALQVIDGYSFTDPRNQLLYGYRPNAQGNYTTVAPYIPTAYLRFEGTINGIPYNHVTQFLTDAISPGYESYSDVFMEPDDRDTDYPGRSVHTAANLILAAYTPNSTPAALPSQYDVVGRLSAYYYRIDGSVCVIKEEEINITQDSEYDDTSLIPPEIVLNSWYDVADIMATSQAQYGLGDGMNVFYNDSRIQEIGGLRNTGIGLSEDIAPVIRQSIGKITYDYDGQQSTIWVSGLFNRNSLVYVPIILSQTHYTNVATTYANWSTDQFNSLYREHVLQTQSVFEMISPDLGIYLPPMQLPMSIVTNMPQIV